MKTYTKLIILSCLVFLMIIIAIGCGGSGKQFEDELQEQNFTLQTNYDEFIDEEIDATLLDELISSFTPNVWDFIILIPDIPIQNSTFIQVGAPTENVENQYTLEIGFETSEEGITLYRMYTDEKDVVLQYIVKYWEEETVPDILSWDDVTWELNS
ncbi:MAG: hypothetical protein FWG88_08525 [Oscillospiraceae bacterium]|nr:hypothetical protein [Oscillospiraceae bacterium]